MPPHDGTHGDIAAEVGELLGLTPDPDQRRILDAMFAYRQDAPQVPVCFEAAIIGPRQNIKTSTLLVAALTDLFVFRWPLHVWTAHLFKTSRSTFLDMVERIDGEPEFRRMCRKPRTANNQESIALLTGEEIQFYARSKGGGRGITAPRITLDEALFLEASDMGALLPTMATIEGAQVRYGSSAGLEQSAVLRGIRDRGRAGGAGSLAYFEWGAERRECEMPECAHAVGTPGCALDDVELWAQANPALGRRITVDRLAKFREAMPAAEFAREFLSWWEDPAEIGGTIDPGAWADVKDEESTFGEVLAWAVAPASDLSWTAIAAVGRREDGSLHVEIPEGGYRRGTQWVAERLNDLRERHGGDLVVMEARGPRSSIADDLDDLGVTVRLASGDEVVAACGLLLDSVMRLSIRHLGQPVLDVAVAGAGRRQVGDAWTWSRSASAVEISPVIAATLAVWGTRQLEDAQGEADFYVI